MDTRAATRGISTGYCAAIPLGIFASLLGATPEGADVLAFLQQHHGATRFDAADDLCREMHALAAASGAERLGRCLTVLSLLAQQPARPLTAHAPRRLAAQAPSLSRLEFIGRYIAEHFRENISQVAVAENCGLSPSGFARFMKRHTGHTFMETVHECRIAAACEQLRGTDVRILDIAYAVGFENLSNFNRVFRARRGCTPRAYRQRFMPQNNHRPRLRD